MNEKIIEKRKLFEEGRTLWYEYLKVNGYSFEANEKGLSKLSKLLDLRKSYIRKCINIFLEA